MTSTLLIYPADVLRTKMQASSVESHIARSPFQVLRHTFQHGGVRALYTGLTLPLAAQAVYKSTVFAVNNVTQQWLLAYRHSEHQKQGKESSGTLTYADHFFCGFMGGAVNAALFVTPVEFVRNQLIAQHSQRAAGEVLSHRAFGGSLDVIRYAIGKSGHGLMGIPLLWRGVGWGVARDALGCGCFFYAMKWTEDLLTTSSWQYQEQVPRKPSFTTTLISGGVAGLAFWIAALPLDACKTWVQSSTDWNVVISPRHVLHQIYHKNGGGLAAVFERLHRGWQVAYGRGIPSSAITISVYSMVYSFLIDPSS